MSNVSNLSAGLADAVKQAVQELLLHSPQLVPLAVKHDFTSTLTRALTAQAGWSVLAETMAKSPITVLPGAARSLQATENAWRRIDEEFGLLTSSQVAGLSGAQSDNRSYAKLLRDDHRALAVKRLNAYRFPGFQFDDHGQVKPNAARLAHMAANFSVPAEDVVLWLCTPSGYFDDERPVDHFDEPALVDTAQSALTTEW